MTCPDLRIFNREAREKEPETLGERAKPSRFRDLPGNAAVPFSPLSTLEKKGTGQLFETKCLLTIDLSPQKDSQVGDQQRVLLSLD